MAFRKTRLALHPAIATKTDTTSRDVAQLSGYMQERQSIDIGGSLSNTAPLFN